MTKILIADACKPSLVMTSEVFKDKIIGTQILVAGNGEDTLEILKTTTPDLCVIDFDLPDVDGASLIVEIRKNYNGPILMTAYPDDIVKKAVASLLYPFNDASDWIAKPINSDLLSEKINKFLTKGHRLGRRFDSEIESILIAKALGRGKRTPKVNCKIINLSMGGACIHLDSESTVKKSQEFTMMMTLPKKKSSLPKNQSKKKTASRPKNVETKIRATVAWTAPKGKIGLRFEKLTDSQRKGLEELFRSH